LFRTRKTNFIFGEKCAQFSALYHVNTLHVLLGFSFRRVLKLDLTPLPQIQLDLRGPLRGEQKAREKSKEEGKERE